ncbi:Unknown protein sequence [Pseudomonas amygdali pv. lachrymans]|nr:Unknown protein sequence [Pseudomonas amygdali pv. lachrymans]
MNGQGKEDRLTPRWICVWMGLYTAQPISQVYPRKGQIV